jgi:hypothetical protein
MAARGARAAGSDGGDWVSAISYGSEDLLFTLQGSGTQTLKSDSDGASCAGGAKVGHSWLTDARLVVVQTLQHSADVNVGEETASAGGSS